MKIPLLILLILLFVFSIIGISTNNSFTEYSTNLSVELLGTIITVLFIDVYLSNKEKKIAKKREDIAWTLLKPTVRLNFDMLFKIYKASASVKGINLLTPHLSIFFNESFLENYLKFNIFNDAPVIPKQTWTRYLKYEFENINRSYDSILDKYALHLSPDLVKVIEDIRSSVFHKHMVDSLSNIQIVIEPDQPPLPPNIFGQLFISDYVVVPYFKSMTDLLLEAKKSEIMDDFFSINDNSWRDDIAPKIGSSRL